jgi:hypothetical protein
MSAQNIPAGFRYDIRDFGAMGDGITLNTQTIQAAIDRCTAEGGGTVVVPAGRFLSGTLRLKDHVVLHVSGGGVLLGSTRAADYATDTHKNMYKNEPHMNRCLIFAQGATGIGLEGHGVIDGQGKSLPQAGDPEQNRPMLLRFLDCSTIRLRDLTLLSPAAWTSAWLYCSDIVVDGIRIHSRANGNGDGLDFDGCREVRVSNSTFDTSDDSICLQTSRPDRPCRQVTITNCVFRSQWAGIRIGLLSRGDFEDVTVTNCVFTDIQDSGLKIQMCEGAAMRNMTFSNLVMRRVPRPVFMTFCQQRACVDAPKELAPMKAMRGFLFSDILVDSGECGKDSAIVITGLPGHPIENVSLRGISLVTGGGGSAADGAAAPLPEFDQATLKDWWPEYYLFNRPVPCHGIYARHVRGLSIHDVAIRPAHPDDRPALVGDDVSELNIAALRLAGAGAGESLLRLHNARNAFITGCVLPDSGQPFVRVDGQATTGIRISNTASAGAREMVSFGQDVDRTTVIVHD